MPVRPRSDNCPDPVRDRYLFSAPKTRLIIARQDFTSIGLLAGGLIFYAGILVIIAMFENETMLSITLLLPSIIAVAIFVYGFIAWSVRVSLSKWKGLLPDYTLVGLQQYYQPVYHDPRFIDRCAQYRRFYGAVHRRVPGHRAGPGDPAGSETERRSNFPRHFPVPDVDLVYRFGRGLGLADEPGHRQPHHRDQPDLPVARA